MKQRSLIIGFVLVALLSMVLYLDRREDGVSTKSSDLSNSVTQKSTPQKNFETKAKSPRVMRVRADATDNIKDPREDEIENLKRELKTAKVELEKLSRPLSQNILSSTVSAEISPGETLVTGGYKTADGNHEITLITPRSVTLDDGSEAIEIKSRVLSVGPEFVRKNGMESLATNARNTLQHGEAWQQDDINTTLASASKSDGVEMLSSPRIIVASSSPFALKMGVVGGPQFEIEGTVVKNSDGGFSIQSRVERTPEASGE